MKETIADKLIFIPNDDTQNYSLCRLKLKIKTFQHSTLLTNQSKLLSQRIRKRYHEILETSLFNSPFSPLSMGNLDFFLYIFVFTAKYNIPLLGEEVSMLLLKLIQKHREELQH